MAGECLEKVEGEVLLSFPIIIMATGNLDLSFLWICDAGLNTNQFSQAQHVRYNKPAMILA